jgi:hypothetical protein
LHLSRGGDILTYRKGYNNDASGGDAANELTLDKKTMEMTMSREPLNSSSFFPFEEKNQETMTS